MINNSNKDSYHKTGILQVLPALISGGVERGTIEITEALIKNGYRAYVVSAGGPMISALYQMGATHIKMSLESKNPFVIYKNSKLLASIIKEYNIQIIHARSRAPAWSAYLAARRTGCNFITTFHGVYKITNFIKRAYNAIMTKGQYIIAVSNYIDDHIKRNYIVEEKNIKVIHRGVDLSYFDPNTINEHRIMQMAKKLNIQLDKPLILLPARITRWKGHLYLLQALRRLPANSFACIFVGSDKGHVSYRKEIKRTIAEYGLNHEVAIINNVLDMPALYMLADIVISASIEPEAFGRVVTEAQAMGRMVIATNLGGACETVLHGKTGWLVPHDDAEILYQTIEKVLKLAPREKDIISEAARNHIRDNFSVEMMCNKTINIYKKLLK
ncbi:GT1 family glycosyltransferase [Rickettsiales bacterium Ac37b]|nr:GT1 family glycosyltransferase [Rickettsiales bacterium Ac37b]